MDVVRITYLICYNIRREQPVAGSVVDENGVIIYASEKVEAAENPVQMPELFRNN